MKEPDTSMSRLIDQIKEALTAFAGCKSPPALIGGLALAAHNVVRATRDVDFLADADDADRLHQMLLELGYRCVHRSQDAANYVRNEEGLDLLYAHRPEARRLLAAAEELTTGVGRLRVVSAEGLIGFKLQAHVNDPARTRDLDDIRALLKANRASLDMSQVRSYFALFQREELLDDLLAEPRP
ncbi:nucleotidyltransferase family protein [Luteimonas sp. SJ-92]|uniref:Nucleotidyltransferase family protein n=1 Tax=Luteimonas salinisoli TaxID=2752307 RepID=A0A853J9T3_9GAMM|nr:nucleotidyltransferase family protein [Luteimonas salinisoli]NZA25913.1 nucleotidyltransferase family protein [Luteimonas salinisoli]